MANRTHMRDTCSTCNKKVKGPKFSCFACNKVLHLTPECTLFAEEDIKVLIKLDENLLHICNDCKPNRNDLALRCEQEPKTKVDEQLNRLQEQMEALVDKVERSSDLIAHVQNDVKAIKEKPSSFREAVRNVQPGRTVNSFSVPKVTLGLRIRGVPESKATTDIARMQEDLAAIEKILTHLEIEDRKLVKATRIGKFNAQKGPRTLLINTENALSKSLILKSAAKLKDYRELKVYISPELSKEDLEKENNCLKERRNLIDHGFDAKAIRIRNLTLEVLQNKEWIALQDSEAVNKLVTGQPNSNEQKDI